MEYQKDQSNYLISNDGLSVMDLPVNSIKQIQSAPVRRVPESSYQQSAPKPKTPVLIPPMRYIVYNNPQGVYDYLVSKGYNVNNTVPSTYQFAKIYIRDKGEAGIMDLIKNAHPDKDIILKALGHKEDSKFCCGFNGEGEESRLEEKKDDKKDKKDETKGKDENTVLGFKINANTIIVILVVILFFVLITRGKKS